MKQRRWHRIGFWKLLLGLGLLLLPLQGFAQTPFEEWESRGVCPQPRQTLKAPERYLKMKNPLPASTDNVVAGQTLFQVDAQPHACRVCHGVSGDGLGILFKQVHPKPRNFTCYQVMDNLPDGQLFWVIQNGSKGTAMPAFQDLSDKQIWQLILYLRSFSNK